MEANSAIKRKKKKRISGTKEWAVANVNIYQGCPNDCRYCYAKSMAIRFKRNTSDTWKVWSINHNAFNKKYKKYDGRLMFPSSHDITMTNLNDCKNIITKLVEAGNNILIVSKPVYYCIKSICDEFISYRDKISFRFTITSKSDETLKFWEPNAPSFEERLNYLKYAFNNNYQTSISCEPYLDDTVIDLVNDIRPYVNDSIWIGKANRLAGILKINGHKDNETLKKANELFELYKSGYSRKLYDVYKDDNLIKWKDSLKKEFGIPEADKSGLDQ